MYKKLGFFIKKNAPYLARVLVFSPKKGLVIKTTRNSLQPTLLLLKTSVFMQYKTLVDIIVCDMPDQPLRFSVNYVLLSTQFNSRVQVVTYTNEVENLNSVVGIFKSADWLEREA